MANTGITPRPNTKTFRGQSDLILFDAPTAGYTNTTTLADVTTTGISFGQIINSSTNFDGQEASIEILYDEQNEVIGGKPQRGNFSVTFKVADLSPDMLEAVLKATKLTISSESTSFKNISNAMGFNKLPVQTRPFAMVNDEGTMAILVPKATVVASLSWENGWGCITVKVSEQLIETAELHSVMMLDAQPIAASAGA